MEQTIKAIIFDFGNVLVNWDARNLYKRFFPDLEAVDSFLEEIQFLEWNSRQDAGRSFKEGVEALSKEFPHYAGLIQAYDEHWEESITDTIYGTVEIVKGLNQAGYTLHLLTNFSKEKFDLIRDRYEFLNLFTTIIVSAEHKLIKPDPRLFEVTLQLIGMSPEECLFIDDSPANIKSAQDLGFHTIHFKSPEALKSEITKYI